MKTSIKNFRSGYRPTLKDHPADSEMNKLLRLVWGNSPLATVSKTLSFNEAIELLEKGEGEILGKTLTVGIYRDKELIGTGAWKIHPWREIELSSLAVLKTYRGRGLSGLITSYFKSTAKSFLKRGFYFSTYATIGSPVMYRAIEDVAQVANSKAFPFNITPCIVPVGTAHAKANIENPGYYCQKSGRAYTSTFQVLSINEKNPPFLAGNLVKNFSSALRALILSYPHRYSNVFKVQDKNLVVLLPVRLVLINIKGINYSQNIKFISQQKKENGEKLIQVRVPLANQFEKVHQALIYNKEFLIAGLTVSDNFYQLCYISGTCAWENLKRVTALLIKEKIPILSNFARLLDKVNTEQIWRK